MVYNDTANLLGIIQDVEGKCDFADGYISGDTPKLKTFTRYSVEVMADLWHTCWTASNKWKYDDRNNTNLPQSTTELTSGVYKYALPSEALTISRIELMNQDGEYYRIEPMDFENSRAEDNSVSGQPIKYRMVNGTIILNCAPSYTQANGFKVYFDRGAVSFVYNDTTKEPGIPSPYHYLVPTGMAIKWLTIKQPNSPTLPLLMKSYEEGKIKLAEMISERFEDLVPVLRGKIENCE
jgi:hypothetical protein